MAFKNSSSSPNRRQGVQRSNSDSFRWVGGLVLLFGGLFAVASVLFSFVSWDVDQSILQKTAEERELLGGEVENLCGELGARIGQLLVDDSFGLFGILIPVMVTLIGLRIIRQRPLLVNHSILSLLLVLILGSLTLGFAFGKNWSLCCSTGWGGTFGIETAAWLHGHIGVFGTLILLLGGWILTGVFINRNFINKVNRAGNVMVDRGERIVETVRRKVSGRVAEDEPLGGEAFRDTEPAAAEPESESEPDLGPHAAPVRPGVAAAEPTFAPDAGERSSAASGIEAVDAAVLRAAVQREAEHDNPQSPTAPDGERRDVVHRPATAEDPFVELAPDGTPLAAKEQQDSPLTSEDGEFTEVDLAHPEGRVVMGRGGLVELDRPAMPSRSADAQNEPFTEILMPGAAEETHPAAPQPGVSDRREPSANRPVFEEISVAGDKAEPTAATSAATSAATPAADAAGGLVVTVEAHEAQLAEKRHLPTDNYDPLKDLVNYRKPPVTLLEDYVSDSEVSDEEIFENKTRIEETLKNFGIPIQRIKATVGPTVTLYEIVQKQGVKISRIQGLQNDIAQSLKAESGIRIIAPIPGRGTIGIEVPNRHKQVVSMYSALRSKRFYDQVQRAELPVVIGRTIQNENYVFDLTKMPHLLVAGATGQGKSVGLNAIITSLLYSKHPAQLKFVMIDPKMVEFSLYAKIERHFLAKMESEDEAIITDPKKAVYTLNSLCVEMDNRLELCKRAGTRNIVEYNQKFVSRQLNPMHGHRFLPYIVVVIDEFADLIMTAKEVETPVTRLAQKARAIGIHLIIATQRPSVDVITGKIKANFPARIAFRVMQMIDSRTILDRPGADQLIGRGDMLISKDGELTRIQCALVETKEVERIVDYISKQQGYTSAYTLPDYTPDSNGDGGLGSEESSAPVKYDSLFAEIARDVVSGGQISTSMIQRNYEVGFNRAGRIMLQLERAGIVGRQQGAKPRDILYHDLPSLEAKLQEMGLF